MKQNFKDNELAKVVTALGTKFNISVNRAGNIKVLDPNNCGKGDLKEKIFWTFYHNEFGYLWRRHIGCGYCYPLNMTGRKNHGRPFEYIDNNGHNRKTYYRPYDIRNSYFNSFDEALEYFVTYLKKYRGINL